MKELMQKAVARAMQKQEAKIKDAIAATDWDDTDVLHIVQWGPDLARATDFDQPTEEADIIGEVEVFRYTGQAPPLDTYADGRRGYQVQALTKPLLDRLKDDHDLDLPSQERDQ